MSRTKKVRSAGKFGPRYGLRVRRTWLEIEAVQRQKYVCRKCGKKTVKRVGTGIWECRHCGYKFAGGCYQPTTAGGKIADKTVR